MSLWDYDINNAPAQAFEAVDGVVALIKSANLLSGALYLGSNDNIHGHEEPVEKPQRWVLVTEFQPLGGKAVTNDGLNKVILHVKLDGEKNMLNPEVYSEQAMIAAAVKWHAAVHARIQRSIVGKKLTLTRSETGLRLRKLTEPTRPEYYPDTDTRSSFTRYAITLQPKPPSP